MGPNGEGRLPSVIKGAARDKVSQMVKHVHTTCVNPRPRVKVGSGGVQGTGVNGWELVERSAYRWPLEDEELESLDDDTGAYLCIYGDGDSIGGTTHPYHNLCHAHAHAQAVEEGCDDPDNEVAFAIAQAKAERGAGAAAFMPTSEADVDAFFASAHDADGLAKYGRAKWNGLKHVLRLPNPDSVEDMQRYVRLSAFFDENDVADVTGDGAVLLTTGAHLHRRR